MADYNTVDKGNNSPLIRAGHRKLWPIFDLLVAQPSLNAEIVSRQTGSALQVLCGYASSDSKALNAVHTLLGLGADVNNMCQLFLGTPLIRAVFVLDHESSGSYQRENLVRLLVRSGADVNLAPQRCNAGRNCSGVIQPHREHYQLPH